jgi:hypothetical protein
LTCVTLREQECMYSVATVELEVRVHLFSEIFVVKRDAQIKLEVLAGLIRDRCEEMFQIVDSLQARDVRSAEAKEVHRRLWHVVVAEQISLRQTAEFLLKFTHAVNKYLYIRSIIAKFPPSVFDLPLVVPLSPKNPTIWSSR